MEEKKGEKKFLTCSECNQECCNNVIVQIDEPETKKDWEEIKWQVARENVRVIKDNEGDWCVEFITKCKHIAPDGKCLIYDKRPGMCREHDPETCIVNGEGEYYEVILSSIEDVEKYLEAHPDEIEEEMVEVNVCPKCGHEWVDEEDEIEEEEFEDNNDEDKNKTTSQFITGENSKDF